MDTKTFTKNGKYLMLALDHRESFKRMLNPDNPERVGEDEIIELKKQIIEAVMDQCSGILIDPVYGLPAYRKTAESKITKPPFLLSMEKSGYEEKGSERYTSLQYKSAELKMLGASGVKLLLYFNPTGESAKHQIDVALEVLEDAYSQGLPLFLEVVTYGTDNTGHAILESLRMLLAAKVKPDVWKLEFPGEGESCQRITQLVGDTPWILLTRGAKFDIFEKQLQAAVQNGASGFLAGRALWQEVLRLGGEEKTEFFQKTLPSRFQEISKLCM